MKKLGTLLCLSSALLVSTVAHSWEGNWLVGGSLGFGNRAGSFNYVEDKVPAVGPVFTHNAFKVDLAEDYWLLGLFGGYQCRHNNIVMGLELNVDWNGDNDDMNFNSTTFNVPTAPGLPTGWAATVNYKREFVLGLSARFGYQLTSWMMPYVRLGVTTSNDKMEYSAVGTNNLAISIDDSRQTYRLLSGVGAEFPIPQVAGLSVRAEYNHESTGKPVNADGILSTGSRVYVSTEPYVNTGKLSVVWNFV